MAQVISSGPAPLDLGVYAGDENTFTLEFQSGGGDPRDITGAVVEAQVRATAMNSTIAMSAVIDVVDALNGRALMSWDGEEVRALLGNDETWEGEYDVQILYPTATLPQTVIRGKWTARYDVTRTP